MTVSIHFWRLNMNNISKYTQELTRDQKLVISSTASGFALENMDVLFLSFAMSSMIK
ncbi:MAG: MFS transporter, partial [Lactobacillus iners]|nr:MFS transporter [Lactobacillus iners]